MRSLVITPALVSVSTSVKGDEFQRLHAEANPNPNPNPKTLTLTLTLTLKP